ncbi:MAG TPA: HlyD family type I secretion periplasmic adaptor subunit [Burkholderiales bacterium]|jgi:HlyD family secretion protein|nr:HlyD family type I secretion periplasmic adaptor subunit [Burkholderiales bacterium]
MTKLPAHADFLPEILALQEEPPSPLPRFVLWTVLALIGALSVWACVGKLDVVAVAEGRLVPKSQLRIVQPAEGGVMRELLVKEGERVGAGQVLARMDVRAAEADAATAQNEAALKRLQLRRIEAELAGRPLEARPGDPPRLHAQVEAQRAARAHAHEAGLAEQRTVIARARREMQAAEETQAKLAGSLPVLIEQQQAFEKLARDGYAGKLMAAQRKRERVEAEQDLRAQQHRVEGARAAIDQGERRIAQIAAAYRAQLQGERVEAEAQLARLEQELEKLGHRQRLAELRAPADGVVKDLATHTPGAVLAPGTVLMTLVPEGEALVAEVWLANQDAGFVSGGQSAKLKVATFPFQKYGMLEARVLRISADSSERPGEAAKAAGGYAYRAHLEPLAQELRLGEVRHALLPGMQLTAEIKLGERTVLEYLLSPIRKVAAEAGRER